MIKARFPGQRVTPFLVWAMALLQTLQPSSETTAMDKQDDQARDRLVQQRQHDDQRQEAILERSEEELHGPSDLTVEEKARLAMANQLHHQDHTHEAMLERSEEELH